MNAISQARTAYSSTAAPTKTPRAVEYEVVARVTNRLRQAAGTMQNDFAGLVQALYDNNALWTIFAAAVSDADNALPAELKGRIFYLAEFTRTHTSRILAGEAEVDPLLDVNAAIMAGLRGQGEAA
ncbi:flagellar biosynthesis regulator FlaF [Pontibaca methylaminivorans]|uniref:Flagellar protein FlaF n=1 Tax=Pontibaca methylaminivorans TaxID=515897 RepID=A0A1R3WQB6_9RHOB|nr:flagellar biosynthesis regulator FlaF [Pontibaca methylaminivorans]SIT80441.1 flagellar protein FlaF [Pontibaca methylaminivorans]